MIETKLKYSQETNRAEMKLAEMESYLLSQEKTDEEIDSELEAALKAIEPPEPGTAEAMIDSQTSPEKKNEILTNVITKLKRSINSLKQDKLTL